MTHDNRKIHVLHLIGSTGLYGAERWVLALIRALDPDVIQSTLINLVDNKFEVSEVVMAARKRGFAAMDFYTGGRFNPFSTVKMARWVRDQNVRIIHGHGFKSDMFGLLAGRIAGCAVMSTPHGWSVEKNRKLQIYEQLNRRIFRYMNLVCPLSPALVEGLNHCMDSAKLRLVFNGVDIDEVQAALAVRRNKNSAFVIGYVGRLVPLKNLETLLRAVQLLQNESQNIKLMIIGDGPERENLEDLAQNLEISVRVEFLGFRDDAVVFFNDFDVFVLPSLSEGIPRCIMEAMAASLPVIASDIPGNKNLVIHGDTGLLFIAGDSHSLAEQIRHVMSDQNAARAMALRGNSKVVEEYSSRRMAQDYTALYHELVGRVC